MRLPQLTTQQRNMLDFAGHQTEALGLTIFNTTTKCVETWNGITWILACYCGDQPCPEPTGDTWDNKKWVGAFWQDNQTGERIIASKNTEGVEWTASIDDEGGTGSWLNLDGNVYSDHDIWTDSPADAENYQLPATRKTSVNGTGDILFRIGATDTDLQSDGSYDTGKKPRYAKVLVSVNNGTPYTIFCRQGHSADSVFRKIDNAPSGTYTGQRTLAKKFSPYNLTATDLPDVSPFYKDIVSGSKGIFVDYPTKAGAFFQWAGASGYERRAYHPTATLSSWYVGYPSTYWNALGSSHETCPNGWRRPTSGATNAATASNASESELIQSLLYITINGVSSNGNSTNYRYFGYYADGYFDRHPITVSATGQSSSAVSSTTKDVAYVGLLYTNPASGASLFTPALGYRDNSAGVLVSSGYRGDCWSSSSYSTYDGWNLFFYGNGVYYGYDARNYGFAVRCVKE
jgi:hypothetical protein